VGGNERAWWKEKEREGRYEVMVLNKVATGYSNSFWPALTGY